MKTEVPFTACFLFEGLSVEEQRAVQAQLADPVCYRKGDAVYTEHAFRRAVGILLSGSVTVRSKRLVANRLFAGDCFGVAALFGSDDDYVSDITADSDTAILFIPQEQMAQFLGTIPSIAQRYVRFLSDRIRFLNRKLATLTDGDAENRVYRYLSAHADDDGTVHLPCSMTELAETLNMGRSSLYRSLDALTAAQILVKNGNTYGINKEG